VIREGKRGPFMSCSGFPKCRCTLPAERLEEFKTALSTTQSWPPDIVAKFGAKKPAEGEAAAEPKAKKAKAPAKPRKPRAAKKTTPPI